MNKLLVLIAGIFCLTGTVSAQNKRLSESDRKVWLSYMDNVARPVLFNLAEGRLKDKMQVVLSKNIDNPQSRTQVSYLEAFGRT